MPMVQLETADGEIVATLAAPWMDDHLPHVIQWGPRVFVFRPRVVAEPAPLYSEATLWVAPPVPAGTPPVDFLDPGSEGDA